MKLKEKEVRDPVCEYAKQFVGKAHKRNVFRAGLSSGWPDDTFYLPSGLVLELEFKGTGKTPSRLQEDKIAMLRDAGHLVLVIDNVQEGKAAFELLNCPEIAIKVLKAELRAPYLETLVAARCGRPDRRIVATCRRIPA